MARGQVALRPFYEGVCEAFDAYEDAIDDYLKARGVGSGRERAEIQQDLRHWMHASSGELAGLSRVEFAARVRQHLDELAPRSPIR